MKSYQRLLLAPRVRSNSITTLAVVPAPSSTSRPVNVRLPGEGPKQLALTQPAPGLIPPLFPCTPPLAPSPVAIHVSSAEPAAATDSPRAPKRQRLKYQLDVGAYGIPKHRRTTCTRSGYPHTGLSVQVGEDAYFVRENAMGIADGVGGWSRCTPSTAHPTPSAMFARRLMHFCSAEIDALSASQRKAQDSGVRVPSAKFSFQHHLRPRTSFTNPTYEELEESLSSSLEELSEGIDVLQILERAYDATVKTHMAPTSPATPLHTGSSTALLAVLDHPPPPGESLPQSPEGPQRNYAAGSVQPSPAVSVTAGTPISHTPLRGSSVHTSGVDPIAKAAEILSNPVPADGCTNAVSRSCDAVLKIAHLGDCMGMLVRGEDIVWRSDEMWWGYNQPLQLGPPSSTPESTTAITPLPVIPHTFTLPVRADDILILASDGLSDNLWDEDVLDEIIKFRRAGGFDIEKSPAVDPLADTLNGLSLDGSAGGSGVNPRQQLLRRKAFAGMLSEALCSRAKQVSERRGASSSGRNKEMCANRTSNDIKLTVISEEHGFVTSHEEDEVPFGQRARLAGKSFRGGKQDDISVIVAVISPSDSTLDSHSGPEAKSAQDFI